MSNGAVMTLEELLKRADEEINYPFEDIIEHYFPFADTVTDYVCASVVIIEDCMKGQGLGPAKKEAIMNGLRGMWACVPLNPFLRGILDPIFNIGMSVLIDTVVYWLNQIVPDKNWALMAPAPEALSI